MKEKKQISFWVGGGLLIFYITFWVNMQSKKEEIYWGCLLQTNKNSVNFMESITQGN